MRAGQSAGQWGYASSGFRDIRRCTHYPAQSAKLFLNSSLAVDKFFPDGYNKDGMNADTVMKDEGGV